MGKVFISYCHKDEKWKERVVKQLGVLEKEEKLTVWDDRQITGGGGWLLEIEQAIKICDVALLLISAEFLNSNFIRGEEVPKLLERRVNEGLRIIPIIIWDCPWMKVPWLSGIQARPTDGKALSSFTKSKAEAALAALAEEVLHLLTIPNISSIQTRTPAHLVPLNEGLYDIQFKPIKTHLHKIDNSVHIDPFILFGYFYIEKNMGEEEILVYHEQDRDNTVYKFPMVTVFDPTQRTIEKAIDDAVMKCIKQLKIKLLDFQEAGFSAPAFRQLYSVTTKSTDGTFSRNAVSEPYIFFKIRLYNKIACINGLWINKLVASKQWQNRSSEPFPPEVKVDLFRHLLKPWISNEAGFILLECVDVLIFRLFERKVEFFMFHREDQIDKTTGWEYVKGKLLYHETPLEGALRKIFEEAGILSKKLKYCGYLGWQTVNVEDRNVEYNTLRAHGLVFEFLGEESDMEIDNIHNISKWVSLEEAKDMVWMGGYAREFFRRWDVNRQCILHRANIIPVENVNKW